jgi:chromosome partitioning protein
MSTTITLPNRKGGVAKTSSTLNLAAELARRGLRVLAVDADPQATMTLIAGESLEDLQPEQTTLLALLPDTYPDTDLSTLAVSAPWGGDLWRASRDLSGAEVELADAAGPHLRLRRAIERVSDRYDIVLVDSPPSVGKLTFNTLVAADFLLIPVKADFASTGGLAQFFATFDLIREYERPDLEVLGIFATLVRRTRHAREIIEALSEQVDGLMLRTTIPDSVEVQDAQAAHCSVREYRPKGAAALAYEQLAGEVLERLSARTGTVDLRRAA